MSDLNELKRQIALTYKLATYSSNESDREYWIRISRLLTKQYRSQKNWSDLI